MTAELCWGEPWGKIGAECEMENPALLTPIAVKEKMKYFPVPQPQRWRVNLLLELLDARSSVCIIDDFNSNQIATMIDDICTT